MHRKLTPRAIATALSLIAIFALGMGAYHFAFPDANADSDGSAGEVRVATRSLDDGRVEVAVQQRAADADWGARQLPDARFLPADVESGVWRVSSGVPIAGVAAGPDSPDTAVSAESGPLFCLVSHGVRSDYFWRSLRGHARQAALESDLNLRVYSSPDGEEQADAIRRCADDGAAVIAATLADPDAVGGALRDAKADGARILTYNSGAEFAAQIGSAFHIAMDDPGVGTLAGEEFVKRGVSGDIGCLIHEEANVGLEQRCEALAESYSGGDVHVIRLPEGAGAQAIGRALARRLTSADEPRLEALLALNGQTLNVAMATVSQIHERGGRVVRLASVGQTPALFQHGEEALRRHLVFVTSTLAGTQGSLIVGAMQMIHNSVVGSQLTASTINLIGTPIVFQVAATQEGTAAVRESLRRLDELLKLGDIIDE